MTTPIKKSDSLSDTEPFSFHDDEEGEGDNDTPTPFLKSRPLPLPLVAAAPPFIIPVAAVSEKVSEKRIELPFGKIEGIIRRQNAFVFPHVPDAGDDEGNTVVPLMNIEKIKL